MACSSWAREYRNAERFAAEDRTHTHRIQAARANFLCLKLFSFFCCLTVLAESSFLVNLFLKALVFLCLRSWGVRPFLWSARAWFLLFSLITVSTLAMAFLTSYYKQRIIFLLILTLIRASLTWGAAETLLTLNWASSFYRKGENQRIRDRSSRLRIAYSELSEFFNKTFLVLLSEFVSLHSLHIC